MTGASPPPPFCFNKTLLSDERWTVNADGRPRSPQVPAGYVSAHSCQESGDLGCTGNMGRQENCNGKEREEGKREGGK